MGTHNTTASSKALLSLKLAFFIRVILGHAFCFGLCFSQIPCVLYDLKYKTTFLYLLNLCGMIAFGMVLLCPYPKLVFAYIQFKACLFHWSHSWKKKKNFGCSLCSVLFFCFVLFFDNSVSLVVHLSVTLCVE